MVNFVGELALYRCEFAIFHQSGGVATSVSAAAGSPKSPDAEMAATLLPSTDEISRTRGGCLARNFLKRLQRASQIFHLPVRRSSALWWEDTCGNEGGSKSRLPGQRPLFACLCLGLHEPPHGPLVHFECFCSAPTRAQPHIHNPAQPTPPSPPPQQHVQ